MSKTKIIGYTITHPDFEYVYFWDGAYHYQNYKEAKTKKQAIKKAMEIGPGSMIEQLSITRSGRKKVKHWVCGLLPNSDTTKRTVFRGYDDEV